MHDACNHFTWLGLGEKQKSCLDLYVLLCRVAHTLRPAEDTFTNVKFGVVGSFSASSGQSRETEFQESRIPEEGDADGGS